VHDIEDVGVAVMGSAQHDAVLQLLARDGDIARPGEHGSAVEHAPDGTSLDEAA
jgi:hypothetical protein